MVIMDIWIGVPLVICFVCVHVFFRHVFTLTWFSVKLLLAVVVYLHLQTIANRYTQSGDVFCIESKLFGIPPGSIHIMASVGFKIIKSKARTLVTATCPSCFSPSAPPVSAFSRVMQETFYVLTRGVDGISNMVVSAWEIVRRK
jgi:hypothetical protein